MDVIKIILIVILIIALSAGSIFLYSIYMNSNKIPPIPTPKILSVNIVDLYYEEVGTSITERCDTCFKNPSNPAACVGPSIKSSFNLQAGNYSGPVYCKVISNGTDLTNPFLSYNGLNNIQDAYGEQLKQRYNLKVCCSTSQDLSDQICSEERNLDARCLAA